MKGCASTADLQGTNRAQIQLSGGRLQIGMVAGIKSESPAGLNRNSQGLRDKRCKRASAGWGPGPDKRGDRRRRRTVGRIERGCGDDGEPVQSPLGQHELSLAVWLRLASRKVCGRAG